MVSPLGSCLRECSVLAIEKVRKDIGVNFRNFRKKAGLSQEKMAEKTDLHPVYISQIERGQKAVSVEALWKISKALRIPMSSLFRGI
jgi:transcriptional regulator with XRE-family HTH domain